MGTWGAWDGGGVYDSGCDDPCGRCVHALRQWDRESKTWHGETLTGTKWESGPHLIGNYILDSLA